jgi:hypothetical protein
MAQLDKGRGGRSFGWLATGVAVARSSLIGPSSERYHDPE